MVAWIIMHSGWRAAFLLVGLTGIAWLLVWWPTYRVPEAAADEVIGPPVSPWRLFRTRFVWSFTLAKLFMDPVWYFYIFW